MTPKSTARNFLPPGRWLPIPYSFVEVLGDWTSAALLGFLLDQSEYHASKGGETKWFYLTTEAVEERLFILRQKQNSIIKKLVDLGLIKYEVKGLPARRWFYVNADIIAERISLGIANSSENRTPSSYLQRSQLELSGGANQLPVLEPPTLNYPNKTTPDKTDNKSIIQSPAQNGQERGKKIFPSLNDPVPKDMILRLLDKHQDLFQIPKWDSKKPSKRISELSEFLNRIRIHKFIEPIAWSKEWFTFSSIKGLKDAAIPGAVVDQPVEWEDVVVILEEAIQSWRGIMAKQPASQQWPPFAADGVTRKKIPFNQFLINERGRHDGATSAFLTALFSNPAINPPADPIEELKKDLPENVVKLGERMIQDYARQDWGEFGLKKYWGHINEICQWHEANIETLIGIDIDGGISEVKTARGLLNLIMEFLCKDECLPFGWDLTSPSQSSWAKFVRYSAHRSPQIILNPARVSKATVERARAEKAKQARKDELDRKAEVYRIRAEQGDGIIISHEEALKAVIRIEEKEDQYVNGKPDWSAFQNLGDSD